MHFFCEKSKKTKKYFSVIGIAKNPCKLLFFSFSQKNIFKSVHLTSPCLHKNPCRKLGALNWLPTCEWLGGLGNLTRCHCYWADK